MKPRLTALVSAVALSISVATAFAAPIVPTFDTFGDLAGATFGGSGIPTDPTAITTFTVGGDTITLALTAHQRFSNPPLTNDGAGTFFAGPGANDGTPGNPGTAATWNFGYYINIAGGGSIDDYVFTLLYDLDPGTDTDQSLAGAWNLTATVGVGAYPPFTGASTLLQDSQNATFGFLCSPAPPFIIPPAACPFDPNEAGQYSFALTASLIGGAELDRSAINVEVQAAPEPASLALLGLGLAGLGFSRRRKI